MDSGPPGQQPRRQSAALQRAAQEVQRPRARERTPPPEKSRNPSSGRGELYKKQAVEGADDDDAFDPALSEPWPPAEDVLRPATAGSAVSAATAPVPGRVDALVDVAPLGGDARHPRAPTPATEAASALAAADPFGLATAAAAAAQPAFFEPAAPATFAPSILSEATPAPAAASFFGQPRVEPPLNPFTAAPLAAQPVVLDVCPDHRRGEACRLRENCKHTVHILQKGAWSLQDLKVDNGDGTSSCGVCDAQWHVRGVGASCKTESCSWNAARALLDRVQVGLVPPPRYFYEATAVKAPPARARAATELAARIAEDEKKDAELLQHPVVETLMSEWGDNNYDIEDESKALVMAPLSLEASATAARKVWTVDLPLLAYAAPREPVPDWAKPPEVVVTEAPRARRSAGAALATARTPSLLDAALLLGDVGGDDDEEKADEADLASLARDAAAALRKSETGKEASRIVKSGAGLFHDSHRSPLSTLEAALPSADATARSLQANRVLDEKRAAKASRLEKSRLAQWGDGLDYNGRCPAELRGTVCRGKNCTNRRGRCKHRFHAPKTFEGGKFGAQPKYMRKIKDEFEEDEDEWEDWDKAAWEAFICPPCKSSV